MYHHLNGKIVEKTPTAVVLDVNGIGYEVRVPLSTFSSLPNAGETVKLLTHFIVREDLQALYGFATEEEREAFKLLISISGIGPKLAITLLSGVTLQELKRAIQEKNVPVLTAISGIGQKTAERVIVELKDKIGRTEVSAGKELIHDASISDQTVEDSVLALVSLGYTKQKAKDAVQKVLKTSLSKKVSVEEIIRTALKHV
ncbi:MAG TPA: Holliday junction branch migration protein RuvA [Candidatus Omnitrophota bacterium]|nr:Holliday junction branch migration protein RuvA [Candidatus Omnitrophota bacterium]HRY84909.1 Holliday junction branch migration protein RuvA [Candidatus Omnitrophota bacterium]